MPSRSLQGANNQFMFYSGDFGEFLAPEAEIGGFKQTGSSNAFMEQGQFMASQALAAHHDMVYSEFTETIFKRLVRESYPATLKNCNPYCPLCLRIVHSSDNFKTCYINDDRYYLIHHLCFDKDKSYQERNIGEILQNAIVVEDVLGGDKKMFDFGLDSKNFYVEISFSHPIHDKNFLKVNKRASSCRNQLTIAFNEREEEGHFPNIVLLPLTDFHLNVNLMEFGSKGNRVKYTKYISMRSLKDKSSIKVQCEEIGFAAEIIQDRQQQLELLDKMNYKYKFDSEGTAMAMVRILSLNVSLPEEFEESDSEEYIVGGLGSSSTIVEQLLKENEPSVVSTIKSQCHSPMKQRSSSNSSDEMLGQLQKGKVELLIAKDMLIDFVKNNNQSRLFQIYLGECSEGEIDSVIVHIHSHIVELIMHEYGNYMVQRLFIVCSPQQRLDVLQTILPSLGELIRNKQGTHTIQAFISKFTLHEEYELVAMQLRTEYYELCRNNNATHFIQKVIKNFPLQYMLAFFSYTVENLLAFALDKNAMCVIKHMIRRFRELEGREDIYYNDLQLIRRQLITHVTFSVDRLIMDSYGNYVIQFCYELFDLERSASITDRILSKFATYAVGKFSSNVILKCISIYWTDKRIYSSLKGLPNSQVIEIFKNKDGNKILLEIMEKLEGTELWDRLNGILIRQVPTRFYHDRWGVCLGPRSSQPGSRSPNFPEANFKLRK